MVLISTERATQGYAALDLTVNPVVTRLEQLRSQARVALIAGVPLRQSISGSAPEQSAWRQLDLTPPPQADGGPGAREMHMGEL